MSADSLVSERDHNAQQEPCILTEVSELEGCRAALADVLKAKWESYCIFACAYGEKEKRPIAFQQRGQIIGSDLPKRWTKSSHHFKICAVIPVALLAVRSFLHALAYVGTCTP
jgi:hypothetical protein